MVAIASRSPLTATDVRVGAAGVAGAARSEEETLGERLRLETIVAAHYPSVWRFLRGLGVTRDEADDLAQQVFLIAVTKVRRIVPGVELSFLLGTALRVTRSMQRKGRKGRATTVPGDTETLEDAGVPPDEMADMRRAWAMLDVVFDEMHLDERAVFILFEVEGLTTPQIAEIVGIPLGTAASRLRRARESFRSTVKRLTHVTEKR